jgi:hypothetical protein
MPGMMRGMMPNHDPEHVAALSLLPPRAEQIRRPDQDFFERLRLENNLQNKNPSVATGMRSILSTMLEPG